MLSRELTSHLRRSLAEMPAVAILGPRQCGKSTLARAFTAGMSSREFLYLDLERPGDLAKLQDPEALFDEHSERLVCIDEIQRAPELFPLLRYEIDRSGRAGRFLILGSASRDLIRQSSESLAGRIRYLELTPFQWRELPGKPEFREYWLRGGFPRSWLAQSAEQSFEWRLDFIRSFLERDVPALKPRVSPSGIRRLWEMLAHLHGQVLNMSTLANSLAVSSHTVRSHIDLLEGAFMARRLPPWTANFGKRLVKSPKLYLRDTGILHALLGIESKTELLGHPVIGSSWESFCIENILAACKRKVRASFYRTARGAEVDLVLESASARIAVEFKASSSPRPQRGFWSAVEDLGSGRNWIIAPVSEGFPLRNARVASLDEFLSAPENTDVLR